MKKKEFLTEAKRKAIIADKEKAIIESFAKTFNKIKRIDENEISEAVTAEDKLNELIGNPISLIRTLHTRGKYNPETGEMPKVTEDKQIDGVIGEIVDERAVKGLKVMNSQGGKIAFLMYDKHSGSFIEGDSTYRYTYKGADETSERILQFILRYLVGVNENDHEDWELEDRKQEYGINPEIDPADLEYGELSEEGVDEQAIIPNEIFQNETYDYDHWEVIKFNYGSNDSVLEFNFLQTETDNACFYLKAIFNFYYKISGSYRAATWGYDGGSPEEYPEEEFIPDLKEIIYVECTTGKEYKLTEEMEKIAIPKVIKAFDEIESKVSEELWDEVNSWGPDGD